MIACLLCGEDVELWGGEYRFTGACSACMDGLPDAEEYLEMVLAERRAEAGYGPGVYGADGGVTGCQPGEGPHNRDSRDGRTDHTGES